MSVTRPEPSKLYQRKMPATWWLKKQSYFLFMLREFSSLFIAIFLIVYLCQIYQLTQGPNAYIAFAQKAQFAGVDTFSPGGSAVRLVPQRYVVSIECGCFSATHRRPFDPPAIRNGAACWRLGRDLTGGFDLVSRA